MAEESRPVNFSYTKKTTHNLLPLDQFFSWSPAAQCLTVFLSEDTVFRTTESRTVSLQLTCTQFKKEYDEPLYIYLRTHFYIIVLCHWHIKSYIVSQRNTLRSTKTILCQINHLGFVSIKDIKPHSANMSCSTFTNEVVLFLVLTFLLWCMSLLQKTTWKRFLKKTKFPYSQA